jgi:hypothetical protein
VTRCLDALECHAAGALVQEYAVDVEQGGAIAQVSDRMLCPQFVDDGLAHACGSCLVLSETGRDDSSSVPAQARGMRGL